MKKTLDSSVTGVGLLLLTFIIVPHGLRAQSQTSAFQAQVQKELAQYPNGGKLYRMCDVFARKINYNAAKALRASVSSVGSKDASSVQSESTEEDIFSSVDDDNEPSIAINRKNPDLIVAGSNDILYDEGIPESGGMLFESMPAYVSTNAGNTWETYRLPLLDDEDAQASGDPIITSDDGGNYYYSFLIDGDTSGISDIIVAHSSNGTDWTLGTPVVGKYSNLLDSTEIFEDKECIAVDRDPSSSHYGRLYVAWTEFYERYGSGFNEIVDTQYHYVAFSDDKGMTWSHPVIYSVNNGWFATVRVGAGGTVFISSMSNWSLQDGTHGMAISTDGGNSFRETTMADWVNFPDVANIDRNGLKGDYGFRASPYPSFDLDLHNNIYAVYGTYDQFNGDAALFETQSTDKGQSWSNPIQVGTLGSQNSYQPIDNDHYMAWMAYDPITSQGYISMCSSEEDTILNLTSRSVRCNFSTPNQMEDLGADLFRTLADTVSGEDFMGDYAVSDAYDGYYVSSWTEPRSARSDNGNIFAYISSPNSNGVTTAINAQELDVVVSPNPASGGSISLSIQSTDELPASIRIYDLRGNEILDATQLMNPSEVNSIPLDIHTLSAGVYCARITCGRASVEKNFVVLR